MYTWSQTRSSATTKSTARPSCLFGRRGWFPSPCEYRRNWYITEN